MKNISILVFDDEKNIRESIKSKLNGNRDSFIVGEVSNKKEAIGKIRQDHVDVILMDTDMLIVNGIETTGLIMKKYPDVKVLTLSMINGTKYEIKYLKEGKRGFLLKKIKEPQLDNAILTLMSKKTNSTRSYKNGKGRINK